MYAASVSSAGRTPSSSSSNRRQRSYAASACPRLPLASYAAMSAVVVLGAGIGTFTGLAVTRIAHHAARQPGAGVEAADFVPALGVVPGGMSLVWSLPLH